METPYGNGHPAKLERRRQGHIYCSQRSDHIMDSGLENTSKVVGEKSLESDSYHHPKPSNDHHHHYQQLCNKTSIKIVLLFAAAALSCFIIYRSSYYNFGNFIIRYYHPLPTSGDQSSHGNQSSSPNDHSQENLIKPSTPPHSVKLRNSSFSASPGKFSPRNLSSPTNSVHGNISYFDPSDKSSLANKSSPTGFIHGSLSPPLLHQSGENDELDIVLKKAAMENKTVILTTLNSAWIAPNSIFDLFLESFKIGNQTDVLLNHLVVVALDQKAYSRCLELHLNCYAHTTKGVDFSGEAYFMSTDYLKMMWRRIDFLRTVLDMGYNFIFTDADVMWFRNPFPHFSSDTDFQIACDHYRHASTDLDNSPNGGFNYVRSNNRTVQFYTFWYNSKDKYPGKHDQDVLNMIKYDPFIKEMGLTIQFLDTAYFGGFCEPSEDLNEVCTMHANCCIGLENKIHDLKMLIEDWRNYMAMPNELKISDPPSWTAPRICGSMFWEKIGDVLS